MRVEREAAQKQQGSAKCKHGGAVIGDTIIFSSHNPKNANLPHYLSHNKPYVVDSINEIGEAGWQDDNGGRSSYCGGSYDIIIKAEQKPVEASFRPVHVILESVEEVASLKHTLRCSSMTLAHQIYDALDLL